MNPNLPSLQVLGVQVAQLTPEEALAELARLHDGGAASSVAFVNAHTLNLASEDAGYRTLLNTFALVLNDGSGISLAAKLQGARFPANLNGTDFTPRVLALAAERGWAVFLLGGRPGVAARAGQKLKARWPELQVAGERDGYFAAEQNASVVAQVRNSGATLLLAAMGNPLQERWLAQNLASTGCKLGLAVGAYLDFEAGNVLRAPPWMRQWGVEWLYRLGQEPERMWRRYVLGNPRFLGRALREAVVARTRGKRPPPSQHG